MSRNVTPEFVVPDEDARYRLYRLCECAACGGKGKARKWVSREHDEEVIEGIEYVRCQDCRGEGRTRELVATATDAESVGVALITLAREGEFEDCPIGILDTEGETGQKWLVRPWQPSTRNVSDAARVLAKSKTKEKT